MKRRALFLDRDGVINEDVGYVGTVDRFVFKAGIFDLLKQAQDKGYLLVVVTNQSGVARGMYSEADHFGLTAHMVSELCKRGITLDLCLACFYLNEACVEQYCRDSFWRKPNPGMLLEATSRLNIDPARSIMLGDKETDMLAAQAAGVGTCVLLADAPTQITGVQVVTALDDVVAIL